MSAGIILEDTVCTINDSVQFILTSPELKGRMSARDVQFLNGLSKIVSGAFLVKGIYNDIRSGMSIPKAFTINLAEQGANLFVTSIGTGGAIILMETPTPVTVIGGVAFYGLSYLAAGNMAKGARTAAGFLYDQLADKYVESVSSLANTPSIISDRKVLIVTPSTDPVSAEQASEVIKQLSPQSGITQIKVRTLTDEGTYTVQSGDTISAIAK